MQTILIAEDEAPLRNLMCRLLAGEGYEVLCAEDAEEALRLEEEHEGAIDLLLTDIRMPGRSGIELYEELDRRRGGIPVLFISGYSQGRSFELPFLAKPFTPGALLKKVRQVLKEAGQDSMAGK